MDFYVPEIIKFDISMLTPRDCCMVISGDAVNMSCQWDRCNQCIFNKGNKKHTLGYLVKNKYITKEEALTCILDGF